MKTQKKNYKTKQRAQENSPEVFWKAFVAKTRLQRKECHKRKNSLKLDTL